MAFTHSFRYRRWYTGCAVLLLLALGLAPGQAARAVHRSRPGQRGTYTNPLNDADSDRWAVESCADPSIIHAQTARRYRTGIIYCTTDPLNEPRPRPRRRLQLPPDPDAPVARPGQLDLSWAMPSAPGRPGSLPTPGCGRPTSSTSTASIISTTPPPTPACPAAAAPSAWRPAPARSDRGWTAARRWSSRTRRPAVPARRRWVFDPDVVAGGRPEVYLLRQLLRRHLGPRCSARRPPLRPGQPGADHDRQPL